MPTQTDPAPSIRRFVGRSAIVTGGGSGIGAATCGRLAAEGAAVAVLDVDLEAAGATAETIVAAGGQAHPYYCDVTDEASVQDAFTTAQRDLKDVTVVVANAGIAGPIAQIPDISLADWQHVIAVNLTGVFLSAKYGIPILRANGGGAVVITASNASLAVEPNWGAYAASKGGVLMLTKNLGIDHADEGIRVNCVCPGAVDTPLLRAGHASALGEEIVNDLSISLPIPAARPDQIAGLIAFLACADSALINASALVADGGSTSRMGGGFGGVLTAS
jgi:NAD(P)-dependent dehydrogenase (short-subunit alcohol dehydrogenase family)